MALLIVLVYDLPSSIGVLEERNDASQREVSPIARLAGLVEPDAVVTYYMYNDIFAVYAERTVLNCRHMAPYDPASGEYRYSEFEPRLVAEINYWLDSGIPTRYVYDRDPPLFDSYRILAEHFSLKPLGNEQTIWHVGQW